jgi:hypothetical protein
LTNLGFPWDPWLIDGPFSELMQPRLRGFLSVHSFACCTLLATASTCSHKRWSSASGPR